MKIKEMTLGLSPTLKIGSGFFKPSATLKIELSEGENPSEVAEEVQDTLLDLINLGLATEIDLAEEVDGITLTRAKKRVAADVNNLASRRS